MKRKFEIRSTKYETNRKFDARHSKRSCGKHRAAVKNAGLKRFEVSSSELVSDFGFRISNLPALLLLALALILLPAPARAHLMNTGFGPFYDGLTHLLVTPEDLLPVVALTLLGGMRGPRCARAVLFALPLTWLAAGVAGLLLSQPLTLPAATAAVTVVIGALVAADLPLSLELVAGLAIVLGLLNGGLNGSELAAAHASGWGTLGVACALFVLVSLLAGQVTALRPPWARVVVRVAGSWIAAIGLFMLGWSVRGA
jgi:hydrogenase/urease accessory protein HupE